MGLNSTTRSIKKRKCVTVNQVARVPKRLESKNPVLLVKKPIKDAPNPTSTDWVDTVTAAGVPAEAVFDVSAPNSPIAGKNILLARKPFRRS